MNKIELFWRGKIESGVTRYMEFPKRCIVKAIRIHAPKAMQKGKTEIRNEGVPIISGHLWWFEGGLIPVDIDTEKHPFSDLTITNPTTRDHKVEVIIVTKEKRMLW